MDKEKVQEYLDAFSEKLEKMNQRRKEFDKLIEKVIEDDKL